jgi:signal transduction histidine kinase/ActR/RegA family two-component response regulator
VPAALHAQTRTVHPTQLAAVSARDVSTPQNSVTPPIASVADSVTLEQVKLLYANLPVSQSVALFNGVVLALVQSMVLEFRQVIGWLVCLVLITIGRGIVGINFASRNVSTEDASRWRGYFLVGVLASALTWGASAYFLYPADAAGHQLFLAFVLGGMVAGSVALLTPVYSAFVLYAAGVVVPLIVRFAVTPDEIHRAMAIMAAVFLLAMLAVGIRIHRTITQSLQLRFENRDLIAHLTAEKARVESSNAELMQMQKLLRNTNEALESRVAERTAALQEHDRRKDEFLAMLGHELRNPLAPMMNALYLLKNTDSNGAALPHAQGVMERQLQQLVRLVDDLLDVSRISQGRIELQRESIDLADVIGHAVETAQPYVEQGNHTLEISLPDESVLVRGDRIRLAQAVSNLLVNAAKYTPSPGRITVALHRRAGVAAITVMDEGVGISGELLPRVFDLFVQGDDSIARPRGGLGIGLTLVQQIVKLHQGEVRAFSRGRDQGSEFTIYLPILETAEHRAAPLKAAEPRRAGKRRRVLVVDDNADAADTLGNVLKMAGHEVQCVYDGPSALAAAERLCPDVILLDIGLPGMDGYEVARAVRADSACPVATLIAVTGYGQSADRVRSERAGFDLHLTKPVDPDRLQDVIDGLRARKA